MERRSPLSRLIFCCGVESVARAGRPRVTVWTRRSRQVKREELEEKFVRRLVESDSEKRVVVAFVGFPLTQRPVVNAGLRLPA